MNFPLLIKTLGLLLGLLALAMCVPAAVSIATNDGVELEFLLSASLTLSAAVALYYYARAAKPPLPARGAFLIVTGCWFTATVFGALPYYLSGTYPTLVDAWFESASGFTTTGASVLGNLEALPPSILLWRSLTQYLGGMGIVVLSLAVLPLLGVGGMDLYKAEAPGPTSDKITAKVSETAQALWLVYLALTVSLFVILYTLEMSFFDALNHALTTMATGGFSTKNASIAAFSNPGIHVVITLYMFLAGVNFLYHYRLLIRGEVSQYFNRELVLYALLAGVGSLGLALLVWGEHYDSFAEALRFSSFQVASLLSTTGYATADYLLWGQLAQAVLLALMVVGGCAGSTAGGVKCIRILLLFKQGKRELHRLIHPRAIIPLKIGKNNVSPNTADAVYGFFFLYVLLVLIGTLILLGTGMDLVSAGSAMISAMSNIGPGLGSVGPVENYGHLSQIAKVTLSIGMVVGRLEIMTVLVIFTKEFWSK